MKRPNQKQFRFWLNSNIPDEKLLIDYLQSLDNFTKHAKACFNFARVSGIDIDSLESLGHRKIIADIKYREAHARKEHAMADYAEWKNDFRKEFKMEPTYEAMKALQQRAKNENQIKEVVDKGNQEVIEKNYIQFITIDKFDLAHWRLKCGCCDFEQTDTNPVNLHTIAKKHIANWHMDRLLA